MRLLTEALRGLLNRGEARQLRNRELSAAIEAAPECASAFVLRGELALELGDRESAANDFEMALRLTDGVDQGAGWGLLEQVLGVRARHGLSRAQGHTATLASLEA